MLSTNIYRFELFPAWKRARIPKEATQSHFSSWQCSITYSKTNLMVSIEYNKPGLQHVGSTQLRSSTPCGLLTKPDCFRLPLACIDWSRTCRAALWFIRRCEKMIRSKRERFLLAWYSQIARKMGTMYNKRWIILWIKHFFYHSSEFIMFFTKKNPHFFTCTPGKIFYVLLWNNLIDTVLVYVLVWVCLIFKAIRCYK